MKDQELLPDQEKQVLMGLRIIWWCWWWRRQLNGFGLC